MANDQCLRGLPDEDLWALRSLRQPDWRIEEVLQAVAVLRGQAIRVSGSAAARWGQCKEVLKSPMLRTELLLFDADQVPADAARQALHLLEGLDAEDIRRASPGAAALFEWARGIARWRLEGPPRTPEPTPPVASAAALLLRLPPKGQGAPLRRPSADRDAPFAAAKLVKPRCAGGARHWAGGGRMALSKSDFLATR